MEFLIFLLVLGVIGLIFFIQASIAAQFSIIAEGKGYTDSKYFWFCVFLGIVGYLMVVALPDKKLANAISEIKKGNNSSPQKRMMKAKPLSEKKIIEELKVNNQFNVTMDNDPQKFRSEIMASSTEDLKLILQDQAELYTPEELEFINSVLKQRNA